nr:uncharacterized protein LOC129431944 isoform X2 [Misgurnus anguillicaudatus]
MRFTVFLWQIFMLLLHAVCYGSPVNSLGPTEEDLRCFNDYETEVKCHLSSVSLTSCSEYTLNVTQEFAMQGFDKYSCIFERSASDCECKFEVQLFVVAENFTTELLKGVNVLFSKKMKTAKFIKPKTPVLSVETTKNGNFIVKWNSKYKGEDSFVKSLKIHLTYGYEGEKRTKDMQDSEKQFEIIGSHLKAKTKYVLTAKMSTDYNDHQIYSDESEPIEFITTSSQFNIIPVVCVALIILIFTIFIFIFSIKKRWWDKISKPKINLGEDIIKNHLMFPPASTAISQIWVDNSKQDLKEEKKFMLPSSVDIRSEKSCNSDKESVDYAQTCSVSRELDNNIARTERDLDKMMGHLMKNEPQMTPEKGLDIEFNYANNRDSGNCSGSSFFTNRTYRYNITSSDNSSTQEPLPCDPSYMSGSNINSDNSGQFNSTNNNISERKPAGFDDDERLNKKNLSMSKNPLYPTVSHLYPIQCDDGYQDVRSLEMNTTGHCSSTIEAEVALGECGAMKVFEMANPSTGQALKQNSWNPALNIQNSIQIDYSYHPV